MAFVAVYDANVLYPASLRDLLIRLAQTGTFQAKWTDQILDEVFGAVLSAQPGLARRLERTRELMEQAIPDVRVTGHEPLIESLQLPDADDRHVLAAAIRASAQVIVTANLKDFPDDRIGRYDIMAQSPDEFVLHVLELAPARVVSVVEEQARALTKPATTLDELLDRLRAIGLLRSVAAIRHQLSG